MTRADAPKQKRRSGIPTGNAGEYFVMGELLRRGYDAQLADRNTRGYDLLVGRPGTATQMQKVQVKTVREAPWYVKRESFEGKAADQVTVYVLLGKERVLNPVRYFIARNRDVAANVHYPPKWRHNGFLSMKVLADYEAKADAGRETGWRAVLKTPMRGRP